MITLTEKVKNLFMLYNIKVHQLTLLRDDKRFTDDYKTIRLIDGYNDCYNFVECLYSDGYIDGVLFTHLSHRLYNCIECPLTHCQSVDSLLLPIT